MTMSPLLGGSTALTKLKFLSQLSHGVKILLDMGLNALTVLVELPQDKCFTMACKNKKLKVYH